MLTEIIFVHFDFFQHCKYKYIFGDAINPNSLDNKGSWRIFKDFYCSVTMLRELGLMIA